MFACNRELIWFLLYLRLMLEACLTDFHCIETEGTASWLLADFGQTWFNALSLMWRFHSIPSTACRLLSFTAVLVRGWLETWLPVCMKEKSARILIFKPSFLFTDRKKSAYWTVIWFLKNSQSRAVDFCFSDKTQKCLVSCHYIHFIECKLLNCFHMKTVYCQNP